MSALAVDALNVRLAFPGSTRSAEQLARVLAVLEAEPLLAPQQLSTDERNFSDYTREAATGLLARGPLVMVVLARNKVPKYKGWLTTVDASHNSFAADYGRAVTEAQRTELFAAVTRVAQQLEPEYGFVHMSFAKGTDVAQYNGSVHLRLKDIHEYGPSLFCSRTFLGPDMIAAMGEAALSALPRATRTSWGGMQIDLADAPWSADYDAQRAGQLAIEQALSPLGVLGVYQGPPVRWKPGARYRAPAWKL